MHECVVLSQAAAAECTTAGTIASPLVVRVMLECVVLSQATAAACTIACEAPVRDHALHHCTVLAKCSC